MELSFKEDRKMEDKFPITIPYNVMMDIINVAGSNAYVLYAYYHSKGQKWHWRDANMAKDLGWSINTLRRTKDKLRDNGYLYWFSNKGNKYTYIGKNQFEMGIEDEKREKGEIST